MTKSKNLSLSFATEAAGNTGVPIVALRRRGWEPAEGDRWTLVDGADITSAVNPWQAYSALPDETAADVQIKTGELESRLALELLIAELSAYARPRRAAPAANPECSGRVPELFRRQQACPTSNPAAFPRNQPV